MKTRDLFGLAWSQILRGRIRSLLCAATVTVGIFSMTLIGALGQFARGEMEQAILALGLRGMTCYAENDVAQSRLTPALADRFEQLCQQIDTAMPVRFQMGTYKTGHETGDVMLLGADSDLQQVLNVTLLHGRLFTSAEGSQAVRRIIISRSLAQRVFGRIAVEGQQLRLSINGQDALFEVIGVIEDQTQMFSGIAGSMIPELVYVPYQFLAQDGKPADQILLACSGSAEQIEVRLNQIAGQTENALTVQNLSGYLQQLDTLAGQAVGLFLLVAGISLLVALFAVAGGMLSAAHEMREQIGIYRAIGARQRDIFSLFVLQSGILSLLGALVGLILASVLLFAAGQYFDLILSVPFRLGLFCLVLSALCGILAGVMPALRAARLDPIQTMRGG